MNRIISTPLERELRCAILAFFAATLSPAAARATVIFDNFDSGGGFSTNNLVAAAGENDLSVPPSGTRLAAEFTVHGGNFALGSVTLPIAVQAFDYPTNVLRVRLTEDNGGAPRRGL
jgi:hypothetical protein